MTASEDDTMGQSVLGTRYALWAIQTILSKAWSCFPSCLSVNSISGQCHPRGPIMQRVFFSVCKTGHATQADVCVGIFEGDITGFKKQTRTETHTRVPHPSLLMQNASSPEPQTQFSTLPWAPAVNSPARRGNRQHLSWATGWRNAARTAAGVTLRSGAACGKSKSLLL